MRITMHFKRSARSNQPIGLFATGERAAFTLVEVMIAAVVAAFSFASLSVGLVQGFDYLQETRDNLRATQILADRMEVIRLYTWDQLNAPGFVPTSFTGYTWPNGLATGHAGTVFTGTMAITNSPLTESYSNDVRQVVLNLSWTSKRVQHHRQMTTLASRYGLQNYVYSTK